MKKKLMTLLLLCAVLVPTAAQERKSHILIYKIDSTVDTLLLNNVRDIYHSRLDANGVEQTDIATLRLRTVGGECVYSLAEIDHVVMPKFGRLISFTGTTQASPESLSKGQRKTSVYSKDFLDSDAEIVYKWVRGDNIYLSTGDKSLNLSSGGSTIGNFTFRSDSLVSDQYIVYYPGQNASAYNKVVISNKQNQTVANTSDHLGVSGDCGTAVAIRQANSDYAFSLDHKTAVICFMPRVEAQDGHLLETLQLKHVAVKADGGKKIAGTYILSSEGLEFDQAGSDSITLTTNNFLLPHQKATAQDSVASYMVIAPQNETTALKVYYHIYDTRSEIETDVVKNVTIKNAVKGATVYPVTSLIPPSKFQAAFTDSVKWTFGGPATLYGSVNLPVSKVGLLWGTNKNLTFETGTDISPLTPDDKLNFNARALDDVKQKAYYYRAYAKDADDTYYWGKIKKFGMEREIIHLGTSVAWSSVNMGATTAEDNGDYYAWGELTPKNPKDYSQSNYQYYEKGKYVDIGTNITGNPQYDVVTKEWRGCWRMPTSEEWKELTSLSSTIITQDDKKGVLYSNKNGNADSTMFVPYAGYYSGETHYTYNNIYNWTGTLYDNSRAITGHRNSTGNSSKYEGHPIRPVFDSNIETTDGKYLFIRTDSIAYSSDQTSANMYGTMRGLDDDVTVLQQGFIIGTTDNVTLETAVANRPITYEQTAADNGSYSYPLVMEDLDKLALGTTYYLRAYLKYGEELHYGNPLTMAALTITTDNTDWKVGMTSAHLYATSGGITTSVRDNVELGFVVGTTPDVTLATPGVIELDGSSINEDKNGKFEALMPEIDLKQYYYRAFVRQKGGRVFYGDSKMLGLEMVDLGLPSGLRWANINIGSQTPMDYGNYYSWGETITKTNYANNATSYLHYGENIGTDINGTIYDAAQVNWQSVWRMPTKAEVEELINYCNWEVVTIDGVKLYKLTSKVEGYTGRYIYLPCAGYKSNTSTSWQNAPIYWTSTVADSETGTTAWSFNNSNNTSYPLTLNKTNRNRYEGYPIRPVCMVNDTITDDKLMIQMTTDGVDWNVHDTDATLHGYLLGLRYVSGATESGFVYATTDNINENTENVKWLKTNDGEVNNVANGYFSLTVPTVDDETVYYYRTYVKVNGNYYFGNEREFGRRTVNLGLPSGLLWSNINVGASRPDVNGDYYAWGEITTKSSYSEDTYTYTGDAVDISGSIHDAAHMNSRWGGIWRMPTKDDLQELIDKCTWTETNKYGHPMYKITGPSGDSIFIANRGYMSGTTLTDDDSRAALWTSILNISENPDNESAYGSNFYGNVHYLNAVGRYLGYAVRPVAKFNNVLPDDTRIYVSTDSTNWKVGLTSVRLVGAVAGLETVNEEDVTVKRGFVVGYTKDITVGGEGVTNVEAEKSATDNTFRAVIAYDKDNLQKDTTYYYRAYVKVGDQYYYGKVTGSGDSNARRYGLSRIDMGNGILWASINLGAQISSEYGDRYAWGETATKTSYTQNTYKYYDTSYENIGADISGKRYDVVKTQWTGAWRMPTLTEMNTLADETLYTWEWTKLDDVQGYQVICKANGNSIFLPAAGRQNATYYEGIGTECNYWTSSLYTDGDSYFLKAKEGTCGTLYDHRFYGLSVRPVITAGSNNEGENGITGSHAQGSSQQVGGEGDGTGSAGTGDTGTTIGD